MGFCYQRNFSNPTLPVDEAQFYALVRAGKWNEAIDQYRQTGEASLKRKLPAFIFQATFDETESKAGKVGAWRKQAATRLTGLVVMDIDHVENPREVFESWHLATDDRTDRTRKNDILLVYITPSGKGLKVVFKADACLGNLIDNQHAMAKVLGVEVDESCKDASRMSFICKESDILFIDKELFTYENKDFAERYTALYRDGHSQATNENSLAARAPLACYRRDARTDNRTDTTGQADKEKVLKSCSPLPEKTFKGRPYSEIIDEWWKRNGGVPQEGERNVKLYQLAVSLRAICDNNKSLLMQVMPRLGLEEQELHAIVESACKETPKGISKVMQEVLKHTVGGSCDPLVASDLRSSATGSPTVPSEESMSQRLWDWGKQIEGLMGDYPILKDICKGLKRDPEGYL